MVDLYLNTRATKRVQVEKNRKKASISEPSSVLTYLRLELPIQASVQMKRYESCG